MTLAMLIEEKNVEIVFINQKSVPNQKSESNFLTVGMDIYRGRVFCFSYKLFHIFDQGSIVKDLRDPMDYEDKDLVSHVSNKSNLSNVRFAQYILTIIRLIDLFSKFKNL